MMARHSALVICILSLDISSARRQHDQAYHKHAHTYLQFCANAVNVSSHACVHKVSAKWPTPAQLDPQVCKEAVAPYAEVGTTAPSCTAGAETGVNIYDPITIPQGLLKPNVDYRRGADVDTLTDWDRIRCRDGQLFNTGWYRKYTSQECARLCSKISNFYGKTCTHFSRQWIHSKLPEHSDICGRDGETLPADMPAHGAWGSAGVGTGSYTHRGQCIFFNSPNNECCATKAAWREAAGGTDDNYCEAKYGARQDGWDSKHRSWRLKTQQYTPTAAWPVTSLGRRLAEEANPPKRDGEDYGVHELFFPNGTSFWVEEERDETNTEPTTELPTGRQLSIAEQAVTDIWLDFGKWANDLSNALWR